MPQRSDQRTSDSVADEFTDILDDDSAESDVQSAASSSPSVTQRLRHRAGSIFSPRVFLYAVLLLGAGMFAGNAFVPLPMLDSLAGLVGVFAGAFVLGLAVERSTILESAAAGAVAAGLATILTSLTLTAFSGLGVPLAAFGAGTGLLAGALGAYFGGDLREGLTADI
jgi:small-conductance mechanosensitive channel